MSEEEKRALLELAKKRQNEDFNDYKGCYRNLADYHCGGYECDYVSPYSISAHNMKAKIFLMLQDWSSHEALNRGFDAEVAELGHTPDLPTNVNLNRLLTEHLKTKLASTYATNSFPFIKMGNMNHPIRAHDFYKAAKDYALPQVRIVKPKLVVCLGLKTFRAMWKVCKPTLPMPKNLAAGICSPFEDDGIYYWCQAHTGVLGQMSRNRQVPNQVDLDWKRMAKAFQKM